MYAGHEPALVFAALLFYFLMIETESSQMDPQAACPSAPCCLRLQTPQVPHPELPEAIRFSKSK